MPVTIMSSSISQLTDMKLIGFNLKFIQFIEEWGNGRANQYYEGNMPSHVARPKDGDSVRVIEKFIRDKYEHKRYIAKSVPPKEATADVADDEKLGRKPPVTRQRPAHTEPVESRPIPSPVAPVAAPIDFMDFSEAPTPAPAPVVAPIVPAHAPPPVPAFSPSFVGFIYFGDFSTPAQIGRAHV